MFTTRTLKPKKSVLGCLAVVFLVGAIVAFMVFTTSSESASDVSLGASALKDAVGPHEPADNANVAKEKPSSQAPTKKGPVIAGTLPETQQAQQIHAELLKIRDKFPPAGAPASARSPEKAPDASAPPTAVHPAECARRLEGQCSELGRLQQRAALLTNTFRSSLEPAAKELDLACSCSTETAQHLQRADRALASFGEGIPTP